MCLRDTHYAINAPLPCINCSGPPFTGIALYELFHIHVVLSCWLGSSLIVPPTLLKVPSHMLHTLWFAFTYVCRVCIQWRSLEGVLRYIIIILRTGVEGRGRERERRGGAL